MKLFTAGNTDAAENRLRSIRDMLFTEGFGRTLEYFCTFSVFTIA